MERWVDACRISDLGDNAVLRFDDSDRTFAIYRSPEGGYFATDGFCSHEKTHLADGLVIGHEIECPLHFGSFDYRTGEALTPPACVDLRTYPVRVRDGVVSIRVEP